MNARTTNTISTDSRSRARASEPHVPPLRGERSVLDDTTGSLLVFSDDWGRHPSSCQHIARQLLPRYTIGWVNTIGMRAPRVNLMTARRGIEKLREWCTVRPRQRSAATNPRVLKPLMWPWFTHDWDRRLNRRLLARALRSWIADQPRPITAVTTIPVVADLIGTLDVDRWVYYCVDDFSQWPGLEHRTIERMERALVGNADVLIAASVTLQQRLSSIRQPVHLLTHGVDRGFWESTGSGEVPACLSELPRPLAVFWGLVDQRLDTDLIRRLAVVLQGGTLALVGPEAQPDPAILRLPFVRRVPAVPYEQLPSIARAADVLVMPYADLPVTRAMQPLKLLEYLATGKPVIVRDLPATRPWADCLDVAATADEFVENLRNRIAAGPVANQQHARARLDSESWIAKATLFEQYMLS